MLEPAEYKITLDNASIPVVIGKPINDGDKVVDFEILYLNQFFNKIFGNFIQEGMFYSQVKESLGKGMPWVDSVTKLMETGETQINTFYSPNFSCWYKTTLDKISDDLVSFFLIDISQDKEHEQQLRRQNLRLAALTDELSF